MFYWLLNLKENNSILRFEALSLPKDVLGVVYCLFGVSQNSIYLFQCIVVIEIRVANYHASLVYQEIGMQDLKVETQIGIEETLLIFLILLLQVCYVLLLLLFSDTKDKMV